MLRNWSSSEVCGRSAMISNTEEIHCIEISLIITKYSNSKSDLHYLIIVLRQDHSCRSENNSRNNSGIPEPSLFQKHGSAVLETTRRRSKHISKIIVPPFRKHYDNIPKTTPLFIGIDFTFVQNECHDFLRNPAQSFHNTTTYQNQCNDFPTPMPVFFLKQYMFFENPIWL